MSDERVNTSDEPVTHRIFLVDDHEVVRAGVRELLEASGEFSIVGEASSVDEALRRIPAARPEVLIVDVQLPDGSGVDVCRESKSRRPELRCLMLTSFADDEALFEAIMAGASGYVLKQVRSGELLDAARRVAAGQSLLDPAITEKVLDRVRNGATVDPVLEGLTDQELRILELISEGLTNREIAERIYLAEKTVKNYVSNMLRKMGMTRRAEAAAYQARAGERDRRRAGR